MAELTQRERWDKWMVQAQAFAKRENYIDALARAQMVLDEVSAALKAEADPKEASRLRRYEARAQRRRDTFEESFDVWNAKIAARRAASTANAAEEMAAPLPLGPDELI
ncbi:MAG: hypothetical protein AAF411_22655 [Myxococcota bacterium]